jgi:hypothetical protein
MKQIKTYCDICGIEVQSQNTIKIDQALHDCCPDCKAWLLGQFRSSGKFVPLGSPEPYVIHWTIPQDLYHDYTDTGSTAEWKYYPTTTSRCIPN